MMRTLTGFLGALSILGPLVFIGAGCTPTDRNFSTGGAGGAGGVGGAGGQGGGGCPAGFTECDGNPETVCETDTASSTDHCGTCDTVCSPVVDGDIACVAGKCTITSCTSGRDSCDNFYDNGCETNINTDSNHCGVCGNSCEAPDAITGCVAGTCQIGSCVMGKLDCDMDPKTGCEVDPTSNVDNCGACGMKCSATNADMGCANSQCSIVSCAQGFGDCNVEVQDGCEADFATNPYHCAMCGNSCKGGGCRNGNCATPALIAKTTFSPGELLIFKDDLNIAARSGGEVWRMSTILNGTPTLVGATIAGSINAIATNGSAIFVSGSTGTARMDYATGINQYSYGTSSARGIDTDGLTTFWTASNTIRTGPASGGTATTFFNHSALLSAHGLTVSGANVYWGLSDGSIWTSPKSPVNAKNLGDGPNTADNLVIDGTNIIWSSTSGIHAMDINGGALNDIVTMAGTIRALAVDTTHVYWTDEAAGLVQRTLKDGSGKPEILGIDQGKPWGLALTSQFVFWANSSTGEIMKLPK